MFRVKYKKEQILKGLRYFSIEIAILWPIILIDTEQMFALQRDAWYNINVNIVYYLRKKNYFRR